MRDKLTDTRIKQAIRTATVRAELADTHAIGLRLRISPGGGAVWVLAVKDTHGKARRFKIGDYPGVGLADARDAARKLKAEVAKGRDPVEEARQRRAWGVDAKQGVGTLGAVLTAYGATKKGKQKSWPMADYRIRHVFARHVESPIGKLTRDSLQATAQAHKGAYAAAAAVRALRPVLKWAVGPHRLDPAIAALVPPASPQRRDRVLTRKELASLLPAFRSGGPHERAMMFMLLTLARREEVGAATWAQVDLKRVEWSLPPKQTKNAQPHKVPLSRQAIALLGAEGAPDSLLFATATGGRLGNWDRATARIVKATGVKGWHRHDLRRTGATLIGEALVEPHVVEAALNHVAVHSPLAATYNRARYLPAVRNALQCLADELDIIALEGAAAPGATDDTGADAEALGSAANGSAGQAGQVVNQTGVAHQG